MKATLMNCSGLKAIAALLWLAGIGLESSAADEAADLLSRVFETNKPWLDPKPAYGSYTLLRRPDGEEDNLTGPFSLDEPPVESYRWRGHWPLPHRVGSIVWTPLHVMAHKESPYTAVLAGTTNWPHVGSVVRVDVTFLTNAVCEIGMGGQVRNGQATYTSGGAAMKTARILIQPNSAVPVYMETRPPTNGLQRATTWQFDPLFYRVDGGLAPRSFDFEAPFFRERQEFQVVGSVWLFKRGDGWFGSDGFGGVGHIHTIELTNLRMQVGLTAKVNGNTLAISLPQGDWSGFNVESAGTTDGPWIPTESQTSPDGLTYRVAAPVDTAIRFYRLRK